MNRKTPQQFIGSFSFDIRLAPYDIQGSIAHATMLGRRNIIPKKAAQKIIRGLQGILRDLQKGWRIPVDEDIHFAIEKELTGRIGRPGQMLHTGRSRNDQVVTDLYLFLKDHVLLIEREIVRLEKAIVSLAKRHLGVVMPGFTHLQHAQPVLFAHHMLAYPWMLERDRERLHDLGKRLNILPLGSAALAGTSFPIDRRLTARLLDFKKISENSIDAVASRDVVVEFLSICAILMTNVSRLAEELVLWSSSEFGFISLTDEFTSGSSIMPQKRNPDVAEIIRGETGRVYGSLVAVLTVLKALPLAYNRDLQEDKPPLFDSVDTVMGCLSVMAPMVASLTVHPEKLKQACEVGFLVATDLADYLARKHMPFRVAHGIVKNLVHDCRDKGLSLAQLSLEDLRRFDARFEKDVFKVLSPAKGIETKTSYGGTSTPSVRRQIRLLERALK
ncbi:MAG: argininosuccinate lyase [Elusimicrobia bacterium]|nr:argininosuccinate lyase [Candidatus Obscuribacterium magneticum]